jgi:hypothetical protein
MSKMRNDTYTPPYIISLYNQVSNLSLNLGISALLVHEVHLNYESLYVVQKVHKWSLW